MKRFHDNTVNAFILLIRFSLTAFPAVDTYGAVPFLRSSGNQFTRHFGVRNRGLVFTLILLGVNVLQMGGLNLKLWSCISPIPPIYFSEESGCKADIQALSFFSLYIFPQITLTSHLKGLT